MEFNEWEQESSARQKTVKAAFEAYYPLVVRNLVIEEVAQHIEKLTGFGQDTISSFAIYIRAMKK